MKKKQIKIETKPQPQIISIHEEEIEFTCPVRGKVKQKVKVHKYAQPKIDAGVEVRLTNSITEKLDIAYSGLMIADPSIDDEDTNGSSSSGGGSNK